MFSDVGIKTLCDLGQEGVGIVRSLASADGVQSGGCRLDQEPRLLGVKDAGSEEDVVAVRLGVVLVAHVVHEPRSVSARDGDESSAQETRNLARRSYLGSDSGTWYDILQCHVTSCHSHNFTTTDRMKLFSSWRSVSDEMISNSKVTKSNTKHFFRRDFTIVQMYFLCLL